MRRAILTFLVGFDALNMETNENDVVFIGEFVQITESFASLCTDFSVFLALASVTPSVIGLMS